MAHVVLVLWVEGVERAQGKEDGEKDASPSSVVRGQGSQPKMAADAWELFSYLLPKALSEEYLPDFYNAANFTQEPILNVNHYND